MRHRVILTKLTEKSIEDLGGTDAAVLMLINELVNAYQCMITIAVNIDNFLNVYEANHHKLFF